MDKRFDAIGIKQVVRLEWYELALNLLLDGRSTTDIRSSLDEFVSERKQSGGYGERGEQTYTKAITQIMKCWVTPEKHLIAFRDDLLEYARRNSVEGRKALHWAATCAAYPFWFRVAFQIGRLLRLQESITQSQIRLRCFEAMGERSTVERSARRVVRTFVEWDVLKDSETKGCYEKTAQVAITDPDLAILMLESALLAHPGGQERIGSVAEPSGLLPIPISCLVR